MSAANLARLCLLAALWGGSFLFMRISAPVLGAIPTTFGRVSLGALGLGVLVLSLRVPRAFQGKFVATMVLGVINSGVPFLMYSFAARVLPAGYSAILNATTPLMGVLIGAALFAEKITLAKAAGVLVGLAGVAVLTQTGPLLITGPVLWGVAACLFATACYGLAGFLTRRWITQRGGLDNRLVALGSQLGAVLVLLPFMGWQATQQPLPLNHVPMTVWLALLALGLLCTSVAFVLYFHLIAEVGPLKALSVTFLVPLFGVLWGWLILDETPGWAHAAGGALIAVALWLVQRPSAPGRVSTTPVADKT